ncbi:MAG: hypothetical protein M1820_004361 [Bogoriella megaspora]|nr:MAG: hypothetical protein M1820_004361 [Bogoriella megaspora]
MASSTASELSAQQLHQNFMIVHISFWERPSSFNTKVEKWLLPQFLPLQEKLDQLGNTSKTCLWPRTFKYNTGSVRSEHHIFCAMGIDDAIFEGRGKADNDSLAVVQRLASDFQALLKSQEFFKENAAALAIDIDVVPWSGLQAPMQSLDSWSMKQKESEDVEDAIDHEGMRNRLRTIADRLPNGSLMSAVSGTAPIEERPRKFRTEREVINRIKHDSDFDPRDFVIEYEDRFLGVKEIAFTAWKEETTEDDFIPLHRIVVFRRLNGEVVWDRRKRIDLVWS